MELIDGVILKDLKVFPDERGRLMEILRSDDPVFKGFGQAYVTAAYPGVVKAWHFHKGQYDNFVVLKGMMKIVIYDSRVDSKTKGLLNEFFLGEQNNKLLQIPPFVYHGFKCISETEAMVLNIPTQIYNYKNPDEFRLPFDDKSIPYNWERKNY
ncbi:MAG: dTDP-4-dehydrorhamnose 3,5-epimerase family protein [Candidatus Diapherotrites archaeon]|nr:dTDP-4-dehydrorhamnose 3,5-epimerase family protein [Candidatus Diapherotrites archaeon]